jgi:hypothetical protein
VCGREGAGTLRAMPATTIDSIARELDRRVSDGIEVRLLWQPDDDSVSVTVEDARTGEAFAIEVAPDERALDVFRHPYVYVRASRLRVAA